MRFIHRIMVALAVGCSLGFTACSGDEPESGKGGGGGNGSYGTLGSNLITIGSTRDITYTKCVLLGTVDFPKITSDHSYGVVYMEALKSPDFDYDGKLQYGGHSGKNDKEDYDCINVPITNSAADGKFEKQIVNLKPATKYYYRAYVSIGQNVNYSKVESFTTQDPTPEITMATSEPSNIYAVAGTLNGVINVGKLQDVNEDQEYGFIYSTAPQLNAADKLTHEFYNEWTKNHFETEDEIPAPLEKKTSTNLNGRVSFDMTNLKPGTSYYYRTYFKWNNKYFYSPEVKTLKTKGMDEITVGTNKATEITHNSAILSASFPFSAVGLEEVEGGFMISKVYTNASEFKMEEAVNWYDRYYYPEADVYYIEQYGITAKDFEAEIVGLSAETTYYVCAYIYLGEYEEKEDIYVYGSMQHFQTEANPEEEQPLPGDNIYVYSEGQYPWTQNDNGVWCSGNSGIDSSESVLYIRVKHTQGQTLTMNLTVDSETNYDGVYVSVGSDSSDFISGRKDQVFSWPFSYTGESVVQILYRKDGSNSTGSDCATVSNITLRD
ncbi:MAG: hypothetical protein K2F96_05590 [Muribaculaceae bacterium]|nr:hypothetical protein [Muribaculaceae bacterium]